MRKLSLTAILLFSSVALAAIPEATITDQKKTLGQYERILENSYENYDFLNAKQREYLLKVVSENEVAQHL